MQQLTTFLMFTGQAEAAIKLYTSLFANSRIVSLTRFGPKSPRCSHRLAEPGPPLNANTTGRSSPPSVRR